MGKPVKLKDRNSNQIIPLTRSVAVEMNNGVSLQTAYEGINSTHYTKAEINAAGYLTTETDPTVPSYVKEITENDITYWDNKQSKELLVNVLNYSDFQDTPDGVYFEIDTDYNTIMTAINDGRIVTIHMPSSIMGDEITLYPIGKNLYQVFFGDINYSGCFVFRQSGLVYWNTQLQADTTLSSDKSLVYFNTYKEYLTVGAANNAMGDVLNNISQMYVSKTELNNASYVTQTSLSNNSYVTQTSLSNNSYVTQTQLNNASYTTNVGTITGITMNGANKGSSGVIDLGTVITSETQLSKGTTSGNGNAVTDISVSNHQITLTKGTTFLTEHQSLTSYATSANYDTSAKKIYLKHGSTVLSEINANDFIKDGMVETAYVQNGNLIISFNTDAGKSPVSIPVTDIFNANNYYTAAQINAASYLQSETDPIYSASAAAGITSSDITNWNSKTNNTGTITGITMNGVSKGTAGVVDLGTVVTSYTETDPVFSASAAAGITASDITNWNSKTSNTGTITGITMNGASKGTSGVVNLGTVVTSETDPIYSASPAAGITASDITNWNNKLSSFTETDPIFTASVAYGITSSDITNWNAKLTKAQADGYYVSYAYVGSLADLTTAELNSIFS